MEKIKILASDLDGTLFDSLGRLSEENLRAIDELARLGVHFVPTTGRTLGEISPLLTDNPSIRYYIYSNGATVYDKKTGERIYNCLSRETLERVFEIIGDAEVHYTIRYDGVTYCDARYNNPEAYAYYNMWVAHYEILRDIATEREDFDEWLAGLDKVEVVSLFFKDERELEACRERLTAELSEVRVASAAPYNLEIFSAGAGKGVALRALADMLGVDIKCVAAVGDSGNDLTALQTAGTGFAVANATDELKAAASRVICSNDEHAIDCILRNFIR